MKHTVQLDFGNLPSKVKRLSYASKSKFFKKKKP